MKAIFKAVGLTFAAVVGIYIIGFFITGGNLAIYKFWAPKYREVQREVFEQTQSYVHGKNQYISRLRLQYESTQDEQREALRRLILTEAETIDEDNLSAANRAFINTLRR